MIQAFYPKTKHIAFISDNTYGGVDHAGTGTRRNEEVPRSGFDSDGRPRHILFIPLLTELHAVTGKYSYLGGNVACGYERGLFHAECNVCHDGSYSYHSGFYSLIGEPWDIGRWQESLPDYRKLGKEMAMESVRMADHPQDR